MPGSSARVLRGSRLTPGGDEIVLRRVSDDSTTAATTIGARVRPGASPPTAVAMRNVDLKDPVWTRRRALNGDHRGRYSRLAAHANALTMWQEDCVPTCVAFGPFRLDSHSAELRRGKRVIPLRPEAFAILQYLVERHGQVVETADLIGAVWPDTAIGERILRDCVNELHKGLGDAARAAACIETVPRRGYRFAAKVVEHPDPLLTRTRGAVSAQAAIVGRTEELATLEAVWRRVLAGQRQVVLVSGEAGIGKTALLDAFLAVNERSLAGAWVARGQCVEQYGTGEPFLPLLDGIGRLCRAPGGARIVTLLHHHAPSWLVQLPGLTGAAEQAALERRYAGSGRERVLHEMVVGLEALTAGAPLVLVLEDRQGSHPPALPVLAAVARRSEPARILVLGSYRPTDAATIDDSLHATVQELISRRKGRELVLAPLDEASVGAYLTRRFAG